MGKIICTIKSWWEEQKQDIRTLFETLYLFYTAPVEEEYLPVQQLTSQEILHLQELQKVKEFSQ